MMVTARASGVRERPIPTQQAAHGEFTDIVMRDTEVRGGSID